MSELEEKIKKINKDFTYKKYPSNRISISNIKDLIGEEFDQIGVATKTHDKYFNDPNSKYYQMSVDDIIKMWEAKADVGKERGRLVDNFVEIEYNLYNNKNRLTETQKIIDKTEDPIIKNKYEGIRYAIDYLKKSGMIFDTRELPLYLPYKYKKKTYLINGRFDAIFSKGDIYLLVDWKNNEEIASSNKWKKLLGPCKEYDDCDLAKFTLQLYLYIYILKKQYNVENPISSCIIQFPGNADYYYKIHKPLFEYDEKLIEKIIEFCIQRKIEKESEEK